MVNEEEVSPGSGLWGEVVMCKESKRNGGELGSWWQGSWRIEEADDCNCIKQM